MTRYPGPRGARDGDTERNDFDADPESAARWAETLRAIKAKAQAKAEAKLAAARESFHDELDRVATRDPEDPEGSPWPAIAVVATVLGAAALAWWFA